MIISKNSLGGYDKDEDKKYNDKIIKNVLKNAKIPTGESIVPANLIH